MLSKITIIQISVNNVERCNPSAQTNKQVETWNKMEKAHGYRSLRTE